MTHLDVGEIAEALLNDDGVPSRVRVVAAGVVGRRRLYDRGARTSEAEMLAEAYGQRRHKISVLARVYAL